MPTDPNANPLDAPVMGYLPRNGEVGTKGGDLIVQFYRHPLHDRDHIVKSAPGDRFTVIDVPATDMDQVRFEREWKIYKGELDQFAGQCRIEEARWMDRALIPKLHAINVHTLEQLAKVSDGVVSGGDIQGLHELRERARAYVRNKADEESGAAAMKRIQEENAVMRKQLDQLLAQQRGKPAAGGAPRTAAKPATRPAPQENAAA